MMGILALVSCSSDPHTPSARPGAAPSVPPAPAQADELPPEEDFYDFSSELPDGEPGRLVRTQAVPAPDGVNGWRVLYNSQSLQGGSIVVSGLVFAPDGPAGADPRPVVAWAHGSVGLGDGCAPSRSPQNLPAQPLVADLLARGYVIAATDYEGLGTPGPHPWLVGLSEGRSVLDSVRAAGQIPQAHAGRRFVAAGASQGGGAALFAGELASEYAPELEPSGVVAAAPAAELDLLALLPEEAGQPAAGYLVMGALGFAAAYPDLRLEDVLAEEAIGQREQVEQMCLREITDTFSGYSFERLLVSSPAEEDRWAAAIAENTPGRRTTPAPVLLVHGDRDEVVPPVVSELLLQRLCGAGVRTQRKEYPGADHTGVVAAASEDLLSWIEARSAGEVPGPAGRGCS